MKCRAGLLTVEWVWMLIVIQGSDACKLKEMTAVAMKLVADSLKYFDKANGEHLGTWPPVFPQLKVPRAPPLNGSWVHCGLLFMAGGLQKVLDDQKNDLNPKGASLHEELTHAVSSVKLLAACVKHVLGGECAQKPPPPTMPEYAFEKKQWSRTLLDAARLYLLWLVEVLNVKGKKRMAKGSKALEAELQDHLEGSG